MPLRALTIDLFHTLVTVEDAAPGAPKTFELLGIDEPTFREHWLPPMYEMCVGKGPSMLDAYTNLCRTLALDHPDERIREVIAERERRFTWALHHPRPEILETLDALRPRYKLALASNAIHEDITGWKDSPLAERFDVVCFSCEERVMKPDSIFYHRTLERMGVPPSEAAHVGDGGQDELRGAKEAGYAAVIAVREHRQRLWPDTLEEKVAQADYAIDAFRDLPEFLRKLDSQPPTGDA